MRWVLEYKICGYDWKEYEQGRSTVPPPNFPRANECFDWYFKRGPSPLFGEHREYRISPRFKTKPILVQFIPRNITIGTFVLLDGVTSYCRYCGKDSLKQRR